MQRDRQLRRRRRRRRRHDDDDDDESARSRRVRRVDLYEWARLFAVCVCFRRRKRQRGWHLSTDARERSDYAKSRQPRLLDSNSLADRRYRARIEESRAVNRGEAEPLTLAPHVSLIVGRHGVRD